MKRRGKYQVRLDPPCIPLPPFLYVFLPCVIFPVVYAVFPRGSWGLQRCWGHGVWQLSAAGISRARLATRAPSREVQNLAFAGASNYARGPLSFKHSSADGQSAGLTDLPNGEQVNKYTIRESFTITALLSRIMQSLNSLRAFFFLSFFQLMISIVFKNTYMIPKIPPDIKIRVYENTQDCSLAFPGHLRLLTGGFCVVQNTHRPHQLQQVVAKFRLSVLVVSFVCTKDGGGL